MPENQISVVIEKVGAPKLTDIKIAYCQLKAAEIHMDLFAEGLMNKKLLI